MTREELHREAERIARAIIRRFDGRLPPDAETTISYYISCRNGVDRAAEHVLLLAHLADDRG
jgi:hypothetical protein